MIRHIVIMKFKTQAVESRLTEVEKSLQALPALIPEIKSYEFGLDVLRSERSYDFALVSTFEDLEALRRYQVHPEHQKTAGIIRELFDSIITVDYTF